MNNKEEKNDKTDETQKGKKLNDKKRYKFDNKTQSAVIKARRKKQGYEAVSDQKSHEYH